MTRSTTRAWGVFAACIVVTAAALWWMTRSVLALEARESDTRAQAGIQESIRLALWRMDSAMAPLLAAGGSWTPPLPAAETRANEQAARAARLPDQAPTDFAKRNAMVQTMQQTLASNTQPQQEGLARVQAVAPLWVQREDGKNDLVLKCEAAPAATGVEELTEYSYGIQQFIPCDWPTLREWLLSHVRDIFPQADLVPVLTPDPELQGSMLATLPARLVPGAVPDAPGPSRSTRGVLALAWLASLGAIAAVGCVLFAALQIGERRGRFVSAVTHELRTPLTTFRMYSHMLANGMAPPDARPLYLATLERESERLTRVVESVLLYARLEEGRGGAHRELISGEALARRVIPVLETRATEAGMQAHVTVDVGPDALLDVDVQAVEQILLNVVDNACKYAQPCDPRITIACGAATGRVAFRIRDFGPGIPRGEQKTVFHPFRRGTRDEAGTTPGVGLGLALARGLARALGGDLRYADASPGAGFTLDLPQKSPPPSNIRPS